MEYWETKPLVYSDRFTTYTLYPNTYAYNNSAVTGAGFSLGSSDLQWEKTKTLNIGY